MDESCEVAPNLASRGVSRYPHHVYPTLRDYITGAMLHMVDVPDTRKALLDEVARFIELKRRDREAGRLVFVCTHNSRRSQMAQLWAGAAAAYHGVDQVEVYSGGTEVTAFHPHAIAAMRRAGFVIDQAEGDNPRYRATFDQHGPVLECFSKTHGDPVNPAEGFAAIMTCAEADEACPIVAGTELRVPLPYEDPKTADDTPRAQAAYDTCCQQIATEMLYLFSKLP
ncbi:MAG: hypothetical protein WAU39_14960 [Polyangiales bacterium]